MSLTLDRSPAEDQSPSAGLVPLDADTPFAAIHLGIEYRGEVVRATQWSASLSSAPGPGSNFKIALLQNRPQLGPPAGLERSKAVCVPSSRPGKQAQRIIGEITAAKQAAYLTRRDVDTAVINGALRERQDDLENLMIAEESARFSTGEVLGEDGPGPSPPVIYNGGDPLAWTENLAGWLLARRYPILPVDTQYLREALYEEEIADIFAWTFSRPRPREDLLCALGLSSPESGPRYDPSGCPVFSLIRQKTGQGPVAFRELHDYSADEIGPTGQLASLVLTLFVFHESPEHQIQLYDGAVMSMAVGGPLLASRLTPDLIALIDWDSDLVSKAESICPACAPRFSDARHHLSIIGPESGICNENTADVVLAESLLAITKKAAIAHRVLRSAEAEETFELHAALDQVIRLSGTGYVEVYASVRPAYASRVDLSDDLATLNQLASLIDDPGDISLARTYISDTQVPAAGYPNLAVDQETLLTGMLPSRLVGSKSLDWTAIGRDAKAFEVRYFQAYLDHHQRFHDRLPGYQADLAAAIKKSSALGLLDTLVELGAPARTALDEELNTLETGPLPFSQQGSKLDLSDHPDCPECHITLFQTIPSVELARLAPQVDMALAGQTDELSRRLVEKALAGETGERWQKFLQIIQASKLSTLANTLDNELVTFIKQALD